jgi:hypothetical protein
VSSENLWVVGEHGDSYPANNEAQLDSLERTKISEPTNLEIVLNKVRRAGRNGACAGEIADALGWECSWVLPRLTDLNHKYHKIKPSGLPDRWYAKTKRFHTVYVIVEEGAP